MQLSSTADLGIPLTSDEAKDIENRSEDGPIIDKIEAYEKSSSIYAGSWIDQAAGGVIHTAFAEPGAEEAFQALQKYVGPDVRIAFTVAKLPLTTLTQIAAAVTADKRANRSPTAYIAAATTLVSENTVSLEVLTSAPDDTLQLISSKYGTDGVTIRMVPDFATAACSGTPVCRDIRGGPFFGGIWTHKTSGTILNCTAGYSGGLSAGGNYYMVTAGHCGNGGYLEGLGPYAGTPPMGSGINNQWSPGGIGYCDCIAVGPLPFGYGTHFVLVNQNAQYHYTRTATTGDSVPGSMSCHSGANSYEVHQTITCGTIQGVVDFVAYYTPGEEPYTLYDARSSSAACIHGDSGGPFGNGPAFLGLVSALNGSGTICYLSRSKYLYLTGVNLTY